MATVLEVEEKVDKILLTTSISHFQDDYFCTVCSYIPKAGDIVFIENGAARCPKCGTAFHYEASKRFESCSIDFKKIPNQNYGILEYVPEVMIYD